MTCETFREIVIDLADPPSSAPESAAEAAIRRDGEAHVAGCAACAADRARAERATALLRALPAREPREGFDARVLAAFFGDEPVAARRGAGATAIAAAAASAGAPRFVEAHAPFGSARTWPRWVRHVAVGYGSAWAVASAAVGAWVFLDGGASKLAGLAARFMGSASEHGVAATRGAVEFLASLVVTADILAGVARVVRASLVALSHALHATSLGGSLTIVAVAALALAVLVSAPRTDRRRTRHVHAIVFSY